MKPVNLLPSEATVAKAAAGAPNLGMIGGAAFGLLCIIGVAGYFAMSRVDSVKSETSAAQTQAAQLTADTASTQAEVASLGQPVKDSDRQLAQGAEQVLVAAYTERHDFVLLAQELRGIMEGTGGWYDKVEATSAAEDAETKAVTIKGFMPTKELAASFNERMNATRTLDAAEHLSLESVRLSDIDTKRPGVYWEFTIGADLVDTASPSIGGADGAATSDGAGTTVGDGDGPGDLTLSLDPERAAAPASKPASKASAKPKNPFDIAAVAAGRGGGA